MYTFSLQCSNLFQFNLWPECEAQIKLINITGKKGEPLLAMRCRLVHDYKCLDVH